MPLYTYSSDAAFPSKKSVNFNEEVVGEIRKRLSLNYHESLVGGGGFSELDLFDYCYAILYSPSYRSKNEAFLRIDFPIIPYPKDIDFFWSVAKLGCQLRKLHLLDSSAVDDYISTYPEDGDNNVSRKIVLKDWELYDPEKGLGRIYINDTQYFDQIPKKVWDFYIGGYQPAQKWLKDRYGCNLSYDEIIHYQKIIVALFETDRIMTKIDLVCS
jgi:predicted helicase